MADDDMDDIFIHAPRVLMGDNEDDEVHILRPFILAAQEPCLTCDWLQDDLSDIGCIGDIDIEDLGLDDPDVGGILEEHDIEDEGIQDEGLPVPAELLGGPDLDVTPPNQEDSDLLDEDFDGSEGLRNSSWDFDEGACVAPP